MKFRFSTTAILVLVMVGVLTVRHVVVDLFSRFARYSRLVSGLLMLLFAFVYFTPRIPSL